MSELTKLLIFFMTPFLIYAESWCFGTIFFKVIFLHERCHYHVHYMFRRHLGVRTDCIILLNREKFLSLSGASQERVRKKVLKWRNKNGLRVGLRSSAEKKSMGTCYVPSVDYPNKRYHLLESVLSLVAPYYGCTWQVIPVVFVVELLLTHFMNLRFGVIQQSVLCIVFFIITPLFLILIDFTNSKAKVIEDMESFFSNLSLCESEEEIEACLLSCPPISDAYKLRHIMWHIATQERYGKILAERCDYCGIPYRENYDTIASKLSTGTYYEL